MWYKLFSWKYGKYTGQAFIDDTASIVKIARNRVEKKSLPLFLDDV